MSDCPRCGASMVTPPDPHACSYNRIAEEYCPSCVLCVHPDCGKESSGASINGAEVCLEHIDWAMGRAFAPIRKLEEILRDDERRDITRGIAGLPLTDEECDVAEEAAARILADTFTAPVESEIAICADCGADAETIWNKEGTTIKLCYGCAYGRAGWE